MEAMALADAAVIVLAQSVKVNGMPPLPDVDLMLWRRQPDALPAADHLAACIANDVAQGAEAPPTSR
jgi:hypothetical protein